MTVTITGSSITIALTLILVCLSILAAIGKPAERKQINAVALIIIAIFWTGYWLGRMD